MITVEQALPEPLPATGSDIGIDLGIGSFLTDSNGVHVPNPRHARKAACKLEAAQRALSNTSRTCPACGHTAGRSHESAFEESKASGR